MYLLNRHTYLAVDINLPVSTSLSLYKCVDFPHYELTYQQVLSRCKYTISVDIQKRAIKKMFTHVESHANAVSLLKSGE